MQGPWVFGLATKVPNEFIERRFFEVERRDRQTFHAVITAEVAPGTTIHSDEWPDYGGLTTLGFVHETVL